MTKRSLCAIVLSAVLVAGCAGTAATPTPAPATPGTSIPVAASSEAPTPTVSPTLAPSVVPVVETKMDGSTLVDVASTVVSTSVVTPAGASIAADGVTVTVPAGGVAGDTTVVVTRLDAPFYMNVFAPSEPDDADAIPIGHPYDFGPAGVQFAQPVEVTLPYDPQYVPAGTDPNLIGVAYFTGTHWAVAGGEVDAAAHTVSVRLAAFEGVAFVPYLIAIGIGILANRAIHWHYGGEGTDSDPISTKEADKLITVADPTVKKMAASASVGGVPLGDRRKVAEYLEKQKGVLAPVTLVGPDGTPLTLKGRAAVLPDGRWDPKAGWKTPADFFTKRDMRGDCTDVTNAMVSVFRNLGYPAKAVYGYAVDKDSPHVWGEVLVGGTPYLIDENGQLQPLEEGMSTAKLIRPDPGDPRAAMWDENGQVPYEANWWTKVPSGFSLTQGKAQGAAPPIDSNLGASFGDIEITGTPGPDGAIVLDASQSSVPITWASTVEVPAEGPLDFEMHGSADPSTGAVTGTFTWMAFLGFDSANGLSAKFGLIWKGRVSGRIGAKTAELSFTGPLTIGDDCTVIIEGSVKDSGSCSGEVGTHALQVTFTVTPGVSGSAR
jgi:hypothetical protein